jgi:hypothetical protein
MMVMMGRQRVVGVGVMETKRMARRERIHGTCMAMDTIIMLVDVAGLLGCKGEEERGWESIWPLVEAVLG